MPPISRETAWCAGSKYSPISPADLPGRWITRRAPAIRSPSRTASSIAMGASWVTSSAPATRRAAQRVQNNSASLNVVAIGEDDFHDRLYQVEARPVVFSRCRWIHEHRASIEPDRVTVQVPRPVGVSRTPP